MKLNIQPDKPIACMLSLSRYSENNININNLNIVNANYEKVLSALKQFMGQERFKKICQCQQCISDMAAIALNYLPPHYYVDTNRGGECGSPAILVECAVLEAIETVAANARHSK